MENKTDTKAKPKFAIVSAVYNVEKYLADFLQSIEKQNISPNEIELVLVDDGSTDNSYALIKEWQEKHPSRVIVKQKENGGQASARNLGLKYVSAEWATFIDPDDWVNENYFQSVSDFVDTHGSNVDMVATNRIIYREGEQDPIQHHPLSRMFWTDRLVSIDGFPLHFHGSAPAAFVRMDRISRLSLTFNERVRPNFEDGLFCSEYLLDIERPMVGFLKSAEYFYRKRADGSSTLASSVQNSGRYLNVPRHGYLGVLETAQKKYGTPPEWLQNFILYELSWYFSEDDKQAGAQTAAVGEIGEEFVDVLRQIASYLSPNVIGSFTVRPYKETWKQVLVHALRQDSWHSDHVVIAEEDGKNKELKIVYRFSGQQPKETFYMGGRIVEPRHSKTQTHIFFGQPLLFERIVWIPSGGALRVKLNDDPIELQFAWNNSTITSILPALSISKTLAGDLEPPQSFLASFLPSRFNSQDKKKSKPKKVSIRSSLTDLFVGILSKFSIVRRVFSDSWILIDRIHNANDSAEVLFHHLRRHHSDINAWFIIEKGTPDWHRLKDMGYRRIVPHGSLRWRFLKRNCTKVISSHADAPIVDLTKQRPGSNDNPDFVFLQHGVIKDDISKWLNPKNIRLFITSTKDEYDYIAGDNSPFSYTPREVALTGLPRFDALESAKERAKDVRKNLIIVAPTWRHWLVSPLQKESQRRAGQIGFEKSEFVQNWTDLLSSKVWTEESWAKDYELVLLPHPNLSLALKAMNFTSNARTIDYEEPDIHDIFARAAVLVTDFSSVAFNAAYLRCPVVYFQFDRERFLTGGHTGREGYFDYFDNGFGPVRSDVNDTIQAIRETVEADGDLAPYNKRIEDAFPFRDGNCSERVVGSIRQL